MICQICVDIRIPISINLDSLYSKLMKIRSWNRGINFDLQVQFAGRLAPSRRIVSRMPPVHRSCTIVWILQASTWLNCVGNESYSTITTTVIRVLLLALLRSDNIPSIKALSNSNSYCHQSPIILPFITLHGQGRIWILLWVVPFLLYTRFIGAIHFAIKFFIFWILSDMN